jgi:hypothetical protein
LAAGERALIAERRQPGDGLAAHAAPSPTASACVDRLELVVVGAALFVGGASWTALLLAELGLFGRPGALAALAAGLLLAVAVAACIRRRAPVGRVGVGVVIGGLLFLGAGTVLLERPHEYLLGGLDPGVYVNAAIHIGRSGSVVWWDRDMSSLSPAARAALFREPVDPFGQGSRLIGFYIVDAARGWVVPHGVHLLPAAMAIGFTLGGVTGLFGTPPVLALVGIACVATLARRWGGTAAGGLAVLLLLANPAENWFGRYPAAELLVQVGVFGSVLCFALALAVRSRAVAFAAGGMLGLIHLAKVDIVVVPAVVALLFGWLWVSGGLRREHTWFALGYSVLLVHAAVHAAIFAAEYTYTVYVRALPSTPYVLAAVLLVVGSAAAVGWFGRAPARRTWLASTALRRAEALWLAATAAIVVVAIYGWYVRPLDPWGTVAAAPADTQKFVRNTAQWFPRLGWYLPPLAILLGIVGYVVALRRMRDAAGALLMAVVAFEALLVMAEPRISPDFLWAARRWLPIVIPGAVLFFSLLSSWLAGDLGDWRRALREPGRLAPVLTSLAIAFVAVTASVGASRPLIGLREYAGSPGLVSSIAASVDPRGVVIFDDDLVGWRLSAPVEFLGGRASFVLFNDQVNDDQLRGPLTEWEAAGRPVYWLRVRDPNDQRPFEQWGRVWLPQARWRTGLLEADSTMETPPSGARPFDVPITLYRATG